MGIHCSKNLKADKLVPRYHAKEFTPSICCIFSPLLSWLTCYFLPKKGCKLQKVTLRIPWGGLTLENKQFCPGTQAEVPTLGLEVRFWIPRELVPKARLNESSAGESIFSLPFQMAPNGFIFVATNKNGPLASPNVALQDVFQFHKGLQLQMSLVCNSVTYNARMCNKNHVCHISGPCLKLKTFGSRIPLEPDDQVMIPPFASLNH